MPVRDLTDDEFEIAKGLLIRLEKRQGITGFSAAVTNCIKMRFLSRAQFNALKQGVKAPYRDTVKKLTPNVKSRKKVTLAARA